MNSSANGNQPLSENLRDQAFKEIRGINKNNMCLDCEKKNPKWASIHLGIYLCIDCAGKHRQYGVVYSFIKSINLDSWNRKQILFMQKGGNSRALDYFRKCGVISDNQRHIDYKSPIVQKYKAVLTAEVESELSGVPLPSADKESQKKRQVKEELEDDSKETKNLTEIPNAEVVEVQTKGKKKTRKKMGKKIDLQDFDTMEFDDGVPTEQKEKIIKAYETNSKIEDKATSELLPPSAAQTEGKPPQIEPVVPEQPRQLSEEEAKKKLEELKAKENVKSISSQEFKDTSIDEQTVKNSLNKFQGSTSISSDAFFNNRQQSQEDGSVTKIKDFVSDTGGKIYEKLSGYWTKS